MEEAIKKADALIEALPYIQQFAGRPVVIKCGGNALEDDAILNDVMEDVVFLAAVGMRAMIVHGGGPQISRAMREAGLSPKFVRGHRVTDEETLWVVVRVLGDEVNGQIIECLRSWGGRAASTFRDGRTPLRARRKPLTETDEEGIVETLDVGFVGEVVSVDAGQLTEMTADGTILVIPPIGQDETGQLYNVNADTAAAAVAAAVDAEKVVFMSDVHGIMATPGDPDTFLSTVSEAKVQSLIAGGVISGGMLPKVSAGLAAIEAGVRKAHIIDARLPHSLLLEIFTDRGVGTQIVKEPLPGSGG